MNANRRKSIEKILSQIEDLKTELESLKDEEREYYDNMPESLQGGERGQDAQRYVDELDNALNSLDEAIAFGNEVL